MTDTRILILGDSTSMTAGLERHTYPFVMADSPRWPERTTFVNTSLPGFTSADACAFFFQIGQKLAGLRSVILFLGHCDASATELPKGRYTPFRQRRDAWRQRLGLPVKRTPLANRLTPYEWNDAYNPSLEAPEEPAAYEYNLRRIIEASHRNGVNVILVRPQAHRLFPPGVGKGNFVFYRYVGLPDQLASSLKLPDERFKQASRLHEERRFDEALAIYHSILEEPGPLSGSPEYLLIVTNNYAVGAAEAGRHAEAQRLFELLLRERGVRREIILFNLAQLARILGEESRHSTYLHQAYEADSSLYRIRQPYLDILDRLAAQYPKDVRLVDTRELIPQTHYVDHCHPVPEAQKRLAEAVANALEAAGLRGSHTATVENRLTNPELGLGNPTEFFTYFKTYAGYGPEEILRGVRQLEGLQSREVGGDVAPAIRRPGPTAAEADTAGSRPTTCRDDGTSAHKEIRYAMEYFLKHPFFSSAADVLHYRPSLPSDVGRFPEYFIIRHTIPYLRRLEQTPELQSVFDGETTLLRRSADLLRILPPPAQDQVASEPSIEPEFETRHLDAIIRRVRSDLSAHLRRGPQIYERIKTTLYWYFRETLRYGAHSRASMRYERTPLEYAAETLAMALVIDHRLGGRRDRELRQLISWLEKAASTHERHCSVFSIEDPLEAQNRLMEAYGAELRALADQIEQTPEPALCVS